MTDDLAEATWCEDCDHVHPDTRSKEPWKWMCLKTPHIPGYGYVSRSYSPDPPYWKCSIINAYGHCEMFTPARRGEK